jgi:hypothetical protein
MNINNLKNNLNIKYYNALIIYLSKSNMPYEWLNIYVNNLKLTYNNDDDKLSDTQNSINKIDLQNKNIDSDYVSYKNSESENKTNSVSYFDIKGTDYIYNDNDIYKKAWTKLNNIHKIIKIKEFVNNIKFDNENNRNKLKDELVELIKNKTLTKKNKIKYDDINGKIISLTNLQYKDGIYFYEDN